MKMSRKKREISEWARRDVPPLEYAEECLGQAHRMLEGDQEHYQPEEWWLLEYLVSEAELAIREVHQSDPSARLPFPDTIMNDLRKAAAHWEKHGLARASRAARRQFRSLLSLVDR